MFRSVMKLDGLRMKLRARDQLHVAAQFVLVCIAWLVSVEAEVCVIDGYCLACEVSFPQFLLI